MLTTREYTRLYAPDGSTIAIKPNVEFEPFEGNYTVGSYARIRDTETDEIITLLPGQKITSVGTVAKPILQRLYLPQETIDEYIKIVRQSRVKVEEKPKPKTRRRRKVKNDI